MQSKAEQEAASSETAQVSLLAQLSDSWHAVLSQISGAVDLELIDAVPPDHRQARVEESLVVDRARQRESAGVRLESLRSAVR